jgi:hypothetical protein
MRNSTRRRYYGRSDITSSLRGAAQKLEAVILELKKPVETPVTVAIKEVTKSLESCIKSYEHYNMSGKRLKQKLQREVKHLQDLTTEMQNTPVFQDEKIIAKEERRKQRGGKSAKNSLQR